MIILAKVNTTLTIDSDIKQKSQEFLSELGLDLSTAFGIFLRQMLWQQAIPFDISRAVPNADTLEAIKEAEEFKAHPEKFKRYSDFAQAVADIEDKC